MARISRLQESVKAKFYIPFLFCGLLNGCVNYEHHTTSPVTPIRASAQEQQTRASEQTVDVVISVFDEGLDEDKIVDSAYGSVRKSEAVWFAQNLKNAIEYSRKWGVVRVAPNGLPFSEVSVQGRIIESNGEAVKLAVTVSDATGEQWMKKTYYQRASGYAYHPEFLSNEDVFRNIFTNIANDISELRDKKTTEDTRKIKRVSALRFAHHLVPENYKDYVVLNKRTKKYEVKRLPADNDPFIGKAQKVQLRYDLYLDVLQDYYTAFEKNMTTPYEEWRKQSFTEVRYERQLKKQARNEKIMGVLTIVGGVLAQASGNRVVRSAGGVGIYGGAALLKGGYAKADEANLHSETLRELGESLEGVLEPSIVQLQDRTVTLSGSMQEQLMQWSEILAGMLVLEQGGKNDIEVIDNTIDSPR